MTCAHVRSRLSAYLEGDLRPEETRRLGAHLAGCEGCAAQWRSLRSALDRLAALPRLDPGETIASRVRDRLELESRGPGLALLFRPRWAARPLMVPSLLPAFLVLVLTVAAALSLGRPAAPGLSVAWAESKSWGHRLPARGTEANPFFPSTDVSAPRKQGGGRIPPALLAGMSEGTLFLETVVARDGSVSAVNVLGGDSEQARPLVDVLRRERFEPARYRGRPVAVSLYWLISRMDVRAVM